VRLGERLKLLRIRKGLTQEHVAEQLGLTEAAYRHWENGRTDPHLGEAPRLALALGISVVELFEDLDLTDELQADEEAQLMLSRVGRWELDERQWLWRAIHMVDAARRDTIHQQRKSKKLAPTL
jgi:XRE family transcriptional regulator, regulator of sulfur utilization